MRGLTRAPALALLAAAPAGADLLQDQLLAGMRAAPAGGIAFTAATHAEGTGGAPRDTVARFDGRGHWVLQSINGKPASAKEQADAAKRHQPAPSYAELARWFGAPAVRVAGPGGAVVYRFARLPAGTIKMGSHDASADCRAEAEVATADGRPYVARVRFISTAGFRMMLVAKVSSFAIVSSYAPLADGRPFPTGLDTRFEGSMMGKSGAITTRTRFTDAGPAR